MERTRRNRAGGNRIEAEQVTEGELEDEEELEEAEDKVDQKCT